ncbi:Crp/Fnr family transcriptional regulator [Hydrogenimonas urashimensis]|uniref:Crp/Fnr family transcriptional regulator n=1 Tax=Hydrogenimonas urashimensis TaxID=2740515 RepID=UPI001F217019|nr:Crp/Fnr family transcriptional regulator [Hydrogenimonas urashimensis]
MMKKLKKFYLFRHMSEEKLARLEEISNIVEYKKGTILFFEGDEAKNMIVLIDGILQVYKTDQKGNKVILHHFFPIDVIAEIVNLEHMRYPASAEFETDGRALVINYELFEKEFLKDPEVSFAFIKSLSKKIKYLENVIATNMVMNSTARVAKFICEHGHEISSLKKSMIAADLNMTPETLSRILKKLSTLGLIEKKKDEIIVLDKEGLETFYL